MTIKPTATTTLTTPETVVLNQNMCHQYFGSVRRLHLCAHADPAACSTPIGYSPHFKMMWHHFAVRGKAKVQWRGNVGGCSRQRGRGWH